MTAPVSEFAFRNPTDVTLTSVNFRKEHHGDDHVQAVDLTMSVNVPNTQLDTIVPGLREALYWNADTSSGQADIEGVPATTPNLRFPRLNGGKFGLDDKKNKLAGYELLIEYGLGDSTSNMAFDCCKVVKRSIETKEGGTVLISWQVQYAGDRLDQETCGKLAILEQDLIAITLVPPVVSTQSDSEEYEDEMDNPFPFDEDEEDGKATAEDLFIKAATEQGDEQAEAASLESDER